MHHFVQLQRNQMVDLRDARIDHGLGIARQGHRAFQELRYKFLDQIFPAVFRFGIFPHPPFVDNLIEQAFFGRLTVVAAASAASLQSFATHCFLRLA